MKSSFEIDWVPFPIISDKIELTPAISPSKIKGLSNESEADALGSLLFSTTITVNPLSSIKVCGFPKNISGVGPDSGTIDLSNWALKLFANIIARPIIKFFAIFIFKIFLNFVFIILWLFY